MGRLPIHRKHERSQGDQSANQSVCGLSLADGARKLRVSVSTLKRWRRQTKGDRFEILGG